VDNNEDDDDEVVCISGRSGAAAVGVAFTPAANISGQKRPRTEPQPVTQNKYPPVTISADKVKRGQKSPRKQSSKGGKSKRPETMKLSNIKSFFNAK